MTDAVLGIDVSKNTFDTNLGAGTKARSKSFCQFTRWLASPDCLARRAQDRTGSRLSAEAISRAPRPGHRACTP